jgi:hypothetical protein
VHFSGLFVIAFKIPPETAPVVLDDATGEPSRLNCKEVKEAKLFLLDSSKAHTSHTAGGHAMDAHLPRLTIDMRFVTEKAVPDEIVLASVPDAAAPYQTNIVELGVWNLSGPCSLDSDGPNPKPLKVVWGNRPVGAKVPDDTDANHSSDLSWAAELEKCEGAGKLAPGFWNTDDYETRCIARFKLTRGRLRAFTPDRTLYNFKNPVNGADPSPKYEQAFASALILKTEKADTHVLQAGSHEIELIRPKANPPAYKVAQVSNYPMLLGKDDSIHGQEHFGAYYDLTEKGVSNHHMGIERFIPFRHAGGTVGVYRPKCIFGQGNE